MSERLGLFAPPKHPVLSLSVQAETFAPDRDQSEFEVLVRHILSRFFNNELLASDDETKRVMQIACAVALPTLIVSLFLFPAYHAFPPAPLHRPFWSQASDHYFYVMYSFVVVGAATVYEWDLLFPDILDIFVLSVLPIPSRRLFFARVLALAIFLCLVQFGTSILGNLFLPMVAEQFNFIRHILSHFIAVTMSGMFAATTFLSIQGILLNTVGEKIFRRVTPLIQGASIMLLLVILLLCPAIAGSLQALLLSGSATIRYFPPFWFLGIYESLLTGSSAPAIFHTLARNGCYALVFMVACTLLTYPLAYRRRVRQLIEGSAASSTSGGTNVVIRHVLHTTLLRQPPQRAIFHFISQTILRSQRQRITLAMFGGLSCLGSNGHPCRRTWPRPRHTSAAGHPLRRSHHDFPHRNRSSLSDRRTSRSSRLLALQRHHRTSALNSSFRRNHLDHSLHSVHRRRNSSVTPQTLTGDPEDSPRHHRADPGRRRSLDSSHRHLPVLYSHYPLHSSTQRVGQRPSIGGRSLLCPLSILCRHRCPSGGVD